MMSPQLEEKVQRALKWIKLFDRCDPQGYYLAFSGGKDSVVVKHLLQTSGVQFDAHYSITTVDPPELVQYIKKHHPDVTRERPTITMWDLIVARRMPPTRLVRYCCAHLKERGGEGRWVVTGVRRKESFKRSTRDFFEECRVKKRNKRFLNPIVDWTEADVWEYIKHFGLPYCELYDQGFTRVGCVMCPMAGLRRMRADAVRWPKLAAAYVRAFDRMVKKRRADGLSTKWTCGQEVFDWWTGVRPGDGKITEYGK